jgi:electron transfer flavoprotein beta subunit
MADRLSPISHQQFKKDHHMRIIVCIKQVLDPGGLTVNRKAEKIFVNREDYLLDPAGKAALEAAASLKSDDVEVIAISVGPERVDAALREALARGADRAILIRSDDPLDAQAVTNLLAAAIGKLSGADLVLLGDRSLDTASGELAARLAEALDRPQLLRAAKIELKNGRLSAIVQQADFVSVEAPLPAVVSIMGKAFSGRHADGWRLMDAYKKWNVETWTAAELGLSEDDLRPTTTKKEDAFSPERQPGTQVRDAKELLTMLKREKVIR